MVEIDLCLFYFMLDNQQTVPELLWQLTRQEQTKDRVNWISKPIMSIFQCSVRLWGRLKAPLFLLFHSNVPYGSGNHIFERAQCAFRFVTSSRCQATWPFKVNVSQSIGGFVFSFLGFISFLQTDCRSITKCHCGRYHQLCYSQQSSLSVKDEHYWPYF